MMLNGNQVTVKEKAFSTLHIIQSKPAKDKLLVQTSHRKPHFLIIIQQCNSKSPLNTFYSLKLFLRLVIRANSTLNSRYVSAGNGTMALCFSFYGNLM